MIRSPRLLSDERLATMAGTGSDPAFAMLYRRYDGPLHGYCLSIVKNAEDAHDVLQSAWMKVLVALRSQSRRAPVRPWLFRIVHNEAIDVIRRRRGEEPLHDSHSSAAGSAGADEEAVDRERVAEVVADLRGLPEGQRAALVMREWADFEYEEIALALATSEGNARQLVFTARNGLVESRAGRTQSCDAIRLELAGADGRRLRNRRIRSHLDCCEACRAFSTETRDRRRAAAAVFLPWTAGTPELICGLVGGGATATGMAGGSALLGGLAKGAAVAAIVTGGVGGAELAVERTLAPERADVVALPRDAAALPKDVTKAPAVVADAGTGGLTMAAGGAKAAKPQPALQLSVTKEPAPGEEDEVAGLDPSDSGDRGPREPRARPVEDQETARHEADRPRFDGPTGTRHRDVSQPAAQERERDGGRMHSQRGPGGDDRVAAP